MELSVIVPAFNEADVLTVNVELLKDYLTQQKISGWEILIVNDGSTDHTGEEAESLACEAIRVLHHARNFGLGRALRTGFAAAKGDYVLVLDADLSYAVSHIEELISAARARDAVVTIASPYMCGGRVSNVPFGRRVSSAAANFILSLATLRRVQTATGMVRLYQTRFLRASTFTADGMEISLEILLEALRAGVTITEIPAHLAWISEQRPSRMRVLRQVRQVLRFAVMFFGASLRKPLESVIVVRGAV